LENRQGNSIIKEEKGGSSKMKKLLIALSLIFLFASVCHAKDRMLSDKLNKGLFRLLLDSHAKKSQIKGRIYIVGDDSMCEGYFILIQFMKPDLLIHTFLPPVKSHGTCWRFLVFTGRRIAFSVGKEAFDQFRRSNT